MATLESGFNPTYSENASILTGNPNRVTVEVEDTIDRDFWSDLLSELCPEKELHFDPYHTVLNEDGSYVRTGRGKAQIIKTSSEFNEWHIGCVDSDYDWLLSDYTDDGKTISNNKYLLQTYAYSIENLLCEPASLNDVCKEACGDNPDFDFAAYVEKLSKQAYPLLMWSLYLYSKGNHEFTPNSWREILVNDKNNAEDSYNVVEGKVTAKFAELNSTHAEEVELKDNLAHALLKEKHVRPEDTYLYVRGHELFDHLLNSILSPMVKNLYSKHIQGIKSNTEKRQYAQDAKQVSDILCRNYRYKASNPLYKRIVKDVCQIWQA